MQYCSIQEAWGNSTIKNKIEHFVPSKKRSIEKFDINLIESFTESIKDNKKCTKIIEHIRSCKKCQRKLMLKYKPKILESIQNIIEDYRDIFVLVLVGISIVLFFNLISTINNSNHNNHNYHNNRNNHNNEHSHFRRISP